MSNYCWKITRDILDGSESRVVGTVGPSDGPKNYEELLSSPAAVKFRLYDDDKELYYEGLVWGGEDGIIGDEFFGPLWDFGTPYAGCVRIDLFLHGKWETL